MTKLTVYSRTYCHLCDDMIAGLRAMQAGQRFELQVIDVDSDPVFEARFGDLVPVLTCGEMELCHYHLDAAKVNEYLNSQVQGGTPPCISPTTGEAPYK